MPSAPPEIMAALSPARRALLFIGSPSERQGGRAGWDRSQARERLAGESRLGIVPGASHLFEEPGTLEQVTRLARDWFVTHLPT